MNYRYIAFVYALKEQLRKSNNKAFIKYLSKDELEYIGKYQNKANGILNMQLKSIHELYDGKQMEGFRFAEMNKVLISFTNLMGRSERISKTVFPTTYNYYTRIFIWIFIVFSTLATAESIGIWSILLGVLIGYVFLTTHKIGLSLLDPFEEIPTGVPLNQISRIIEIDMLETLNDNNIPDFLHEHDDYIL